MRTKVGIFTPPYINNYIMKNFLEYLSDKFNSSADINNIFGLNKVSSIPSPVLFLPSWQYYGTIKHIDKKRRLIHILISGKKNDLNIRMTPEQYNNLEVLNKKPCLGQKVNIGISADNNITNWDVIAQGKGEPTVKTSKDVNYIKTTSSHAPF